MDFGQSVWVRIGDTTVREIRTVADAVEFMDEIPAEQRGLLYHWTLENIRAPQDADRAFAARGAFVEFCSHLGVLSSDGTTG
jgi:hypothetical protein